MPRFDRSHSSSTLSVSKAKQEVLRVVQLWTMLVLIRWVSRVHSHLTLEAEKALRFVQVAELLRAGHQVMVFVHARKDTVKTAQTLREKAAMEGILDLLDPNENERYAGFKRDMGSSRNREMKELSGVGFG